MNWRETTTPPSSPALSNHSLQIKYVKITDVIQPPLPNPKVKDQATDNKLVSQLL